MSEKVPTHLPRSHIGAIYVRNATPDEIEGYLGEDGVMSPFKFVFCDSSGSILGFAPSLEWAFDEIDADGEVSRVPLQ